MVTSERKKVRDGAKPRDHHQTGEPIAVADDDEQSGETVAMGDHHQTSEPAS
ncbi:hypothetical protein [Streptomyces sp. GSL17-111]|uniref:hypothetical protein n=1 Tax=Streptomyces sp. GSL17-111 TaxID=3121596 RepID=UPI0030F3DCE6